MLDGDKIPLRQFRRQTPRARQRRLLSSNLQRGTVHYTEGDCAIGMGRWGWDAGY